MTARQKEQAKEDAQEQHMIPFKDHQLGEYENERIYQQKVQMYLDTLSSPDAKSQAWERQHGHKSTLQKTLKSRPMLYAASGNAIPVYNQRARARQQKSDAYYLQFKPALERKRIAIKKKNFDEKNRERIAAGKKPLVWGQAEQEKLDAARVVADMQAREHQRYADAMESASAFKDPDEFKKIQSGWEKNLETDVKQARYRRYGLQDIASNGKKVEPEELFSELYGGRKREKSDRSWRGIFPVRADMRVCVDTITEDSMKMAATPSAIHRKVARDEQGAAVAAGVVAGQRGVDDRHGGRALDPKGASVQRRGVVDELHVGEDGCVAEAVQADGRGGKADELTVLDAYGLVQTVRVDADRGDGGVVAVLEAQAAEDRRGVVRRGGLDAGGGLLAADGDLWGSARRCGVCGGCCCCCCHPQETHLRPDKEEGCSLDVRAR